jgi:glycosyltransferase involved in cell wall biosynthesis
MTTPYFSPSLGGMETVAECLANEFVTLGHEVVVATSTAEDDGIERPFRVLRAPSLLTLIKESVRADAVLQSQISLRLGLPSLLLRRPTVIAHHMWTPRTGPGAFVGRIKHALLRFADNVAVSTAMANSLRVPCTIIANPYQEELFAGANHDGPKRDLVFLGRLIEDKGLGVLLEALALLAGRGLQPTLTVIGRGPAEALHRRQAEELGVALQVDFTGALRGSDLRDRLAAHQLMIVPSIWEEPFGVVVLEGLACGLIPVAADSGGLPDAVGKCGSIVPKNSPTALAAVVERLLIDEPSQQQFRAFAPEHLAAHAPKQIALQYLEALEKRQR